MQANLISIFTTILNVITGVAGTYAAVKLAIYAIGYMQKNPQKIQEAKDGMLNVVIGLIICIGAQAIVQWLKGNLHF
ncbi:MAG: hypothetical protein ABF586_13150 [Sporolactobacillus sp.]